LSEERLNILLVIARPYRNDVSFRSIARPLIEVIERDNLSASVDVLRPPTFQQLCQVLRSKPGYYHLLHFDGHGSYLRGVSFAGPHSGRLAKWQASLIFETEDGRPDPIAMAVWKLTFPSTFCMI
jgi:hypothetical protein